VRIISEFHDYYDSVQSAGQDQSMVYLRTRKEVVLDRTNFPFPAFRDLLLYTEYYRHGVAIVQFVVGFCGKVFPVLRLSHPARQLEEKPSGVLCYTRAEVDTFVEEHFKRAEIEAYRAKPRRYGFRQYWPIGQRQAMFEEFFAACAAKQSSFGRLFLDNGCPIFVASVAPGSGRRYREYKIVYNESLKELQFYRIMDTFTAYQELQMYFGAMAQPNKPIPEVSDKDMVSIKGFDKWSFRKPPGRRK
jgi:hypothetical protein